MTIEQKNSMPLLLIISGVLLIISGVATIGGWILGIQKLLTLRAGYLPTPPVNGLFFLLFGLTFIRFAFHIHKRERQPALIIFTFIFIYGLLRFAGFVVHRELTFDHLFFPGAEKLGDFPIGHMSPYAGILFALSAGSVNLRLIKPHSLIMVNLTGFLGLLVAFAGFITALGYMFGTPFLYTGNIIPLSAVSSIAFLFLGSGLVFYAGRRSALLRQFFGNMPKARFLRTFIPLVIFLFLAEGLSDSILTHYLKINQAYHLAILSVITIFIIIVVIINITGKVFESANRAETERIRALNELQKINWFQTHILENSIMGIFMTKNKKIEWANAQLGTIFQMPVSQLQGSSLRILFGSDELYAEQLQWYSLLAQGKNVDKILNLPRVNGDTFWCRFIGTMLDPEQPEGGTVWMVEDITERKKLREKMRLLSHTIESLTECVIIIDTSDRIVYVNEAFQKTYGYTQDELVGQSINFVGLAESNKIKSLQMVISEGSWRGELLNCRKDGTEFPVSAALSQVLDENGEIVALVGVTIDITERRNAEVQLKKYADEFRLANDAKDRLFSIISHDLRSPFNSILGLTQLLAEQYGIFTEEERISAVRDIHESSERAFALLENLLTWARTQTRGINVIAGDFKLSDIATQQLEILKNTADAKGIKLSSTVSPDIAVHADEDMIKTVLINLISNAIKFTPEGGSVKLSASRWDKMIQTTVSDNGIGIAGEDSVKLFSLNTSYSTPGTANEKGTGLGLLICKEFVERNGGTIRVESEKGKGSRFIFTLPAVQL
jgi:PAS domain S-box-containing protein